jgi:hypothetical protein
MSTARATLYVADVQSGVTIDPGFDRVTAVAR